MTEKVAEAYAGHVCSVCGGRARIDVSTEAAGISAWRCADHVGTWRHARVTAAEAEVAGAEGGGMKKAYVVRFAGGVHAVNHNGTKVLIHQKYVVAGSFEAALRVCRRHHPEAVVRGIDCVNYTGDDSVLVEGPDE
jgi:hypothetical protein